MFRCLPAGVLLCAAALSAPVVGAQADPLPARFESLAGAYAEVYGFSGTIKIVRAGKPVFEQSFGPAERSFDTPNTPATRNSINSISKTFTAAAALRLVERGQLDLAAPVSRYLPELDAAWKDAVTVHHLLSHSSGLPREAGLPAHDDSSLADQADLVASLPTRFEPGARYGYSNAGYIVLGRVLERVSGLDYAELIEREIIRPLELRDTGVYRAEAVVARQAVPYRMTPEGVSTAQRTKTRGESAGGGLYSTPADLYRFVTALEDDSLLGESMRAKLFARHVETDGDDHEGYAWSIKSFGPNPIRFAAGSGYGTKSVIVRDPEAGDFIGIVSNWGNTPILDLLRDLFLTLNGREVAAPSSDLLADAADYRGQLGRYRFDAQQLRTALQADDDVMRLHEHQGRVFLDDELMARGENGTLRLTYTDELVVRVGDDVLVIEIGGRRLQGRKLR
jgi:CubicO group peptidase (beta-lactamase class C family)